MSKRVIFVCIMLMIIGLAAGYEMFMIAVRSGGSAWQFNSGILFVPISIALLLGMRFARTAANIVFGLHYLSLAFMLVLVPAIRSRTGALSAGLGGFWPAELPFSFVLVFVALAGSFLALLHWMLYSPPFDEHLA